MNKRDLEEIITALNNNKICIFKSDTLYGIHAKAGNTDVTKRISEIKGRDDSKPFIILVKDAQQLKTFGPIISEQAQKLITKFWPGKLTCIFKVRDAKKSETLAFRIPDDKNLREIMSVTGPLVSTSANHSGEKPAETIEEARNYFGTKIDLYIDSGKVESEPSTLVDCTKDGVNILRNGAVSLSPKEHVRYNRFMKKYANILVAALLFVAVAIGLVLNVREQRSIDRSKLPSKVEQSSGFQRWITNLKNKGFEIEADEFRLLEENEIYNTKWMSVYSIDQEGMRDIYNNTVEAVKDTPKVVFSPSSREFIDYRNIDRDGYKSNEVHFYGLKEDKIIDARILDCSVRANCYFDRAYFLDNDVFVISEFSRNIDKKDETAPICELIESCEYTIKVHVIDLINNSRLIYESLPFDGVMSEFLPEI